MDIIHKFNINHYITLKYKICKNIDVSHPNIDVNDFCLSVKTHKTYPCKILAGDYLYIENITIQEAIKSLGYLFREEYVYIDDEDVSLCTIICKYNEHDDILSKYFSIFHPKTSYDSVGQCLVIYAKNYCNIQSVNITDAVNAYLQLYYTHILPKVLKILNMSTASVFYLIPMDVIHFILSMISKQ